ncbi:hypothetical protein DDZ13_10415 [Coraliomargarita sinensis]|uniref:Uncharacterized protein n=1 Tax=Coraliomargarita sinensis TaxID=2174842 RepID=A0A317ZIV2_9BACT|nr:hypothetical protein DDZ13_10415 [Coraliomargarita sinensis]
MPTAIPLIPKKRRHNNERQNNFLLGQLSWRPLMCADGRLLLGKDGGYGIFASLDMGMFGNSVSA